MGEWLSESAQHWRAACDRAGVPYILMLLMLLMLTAMTLLDGLWGGQNAITAVDFNHTGEVFAYSIGYDWSVPHALAYVHCIALFSLLRPRSPQCPQSPFLTNESHSLTNALTRCPQRTSGVMGT